MITITVSNDECLPKEAAQQMADAIHLLLNTNGIGNVVKYHSDSTAKCSDDAYFDLQKQKVQIKVVRHGKRDKNHTQNTVKTGVLGRVVHCKREPYDVYIGRGKCPRTGKDEGWGNPFSIGKDGDREAVIEKYEAWIRKQQGLLKQLHTLKGKVLGCWCAPKACHGDVLVKLIEEVYGPC